MKKWYDIIPYLVFGLGVITDMGVNIAGISIIQVTESYMDYIFAGTITISVLCFSLIVADFMSCHHTALMCGRGCCYSFFYRIKFQRHL